jgi:hypothetical protein
LAREEARRKGPEVREAERQRREEEEEAKEANGAKEAEGTGEASDFEFEEEKEAAAEEEAEEADLLYEFICEASGRPFLGEFQKCGGSPVGCFYENQVFHWNRVTERVLDLPAPSFPPSRSLPLKGILSLPAFLLPSLLLPVTPASLSLPFRHSCFPAFFLLSCPQFPLSLNLLITPLQPPGNTKDQEWIDARFRGLSLPLPSSFTLIVPPLPSPEPHTKDQE